MPERSATVTRHPDKASALYTLVGRTNGTMVWARQYDAWTELASAMHAWLTRGEQP